MWYLKLAIGILMRMVMEYEIKDYIALIRKKGVKAIMTNPVKNTKPGGAALFLTGAIFFGNELAGTLQQLSGVQHPAEIDVRALLVLIAAAGLWAVLQTVERVFNVNGIEKTVADEVGGNIIGSLTKNAFKPTSNPTPATQVNVQTTTPVQATDQTTPQQVQSDVYVDANGNQLNPIPTIVPTTPAQ